MIAMSSYSMVFILLQHDILHSIYFYCMYKSQSGLFSNLQKKNTTLTLNYKFLPRRDLFLETSRQISNLKKDLCKVIG